MSSNISKIQPALDKQRNWEAEVISTLKASSSHKNKIIFVLSFAVIVLSVSIAAIGSLREVVPYVVSRDSTTGALEVLQPFDNRLVTNSDLMDEFWITFYVRAREQYNWWLVGSDYETVHDMTEPSIFPEYGNQFKGDASLDKVFADFTERRIKVLSLTKSPTNPEQMTVRFERTTISRGQVVEPPTVYVANLAFRYQPKKLAPRVELRRNPYGLQVYAYRRDVEIPGAVLPTTPPATPVN